MATGNIESVYPLSPAQEGMLFHAIDAPGGGTHFQQVAFIIEGALNVDALRDAWQVATKRHTTLRTLFTWERRERPLQLVRERVDVPWVIEDWQPLSASEQAARLEEFLLEDRRRGFELAKAPLMRLALFKLAPRSHQLVWSFHHLIADGWSGQLILKDVFDHYDAFVNGRALTTPAPRPFQDFIAWQSQHRPSHAEAFWRRELAGVTAPVRTGLENLHDAGHATGYGQPSLVLSEECAAGLRALAQSSRVTLNTVVQAAWSLVLSRYGGNTDVVFGVTLSGRPHALAGYDTMTGMFINTLPLRVQVDEDATLAEWLQHVQTRAMAVREYEQTSLADVGRWSDARTAQALFETILVFENYPLADAIAPATSGIVLGERRHIEQSNFPLALIVVPGQQMKLHLVHDRRRYGDAAAQQLLTHVANVLAGMAAQPRQRVADVQMLSANELHRLTVEWNNRTHDYPRDTCIHRIIEQVAAQQPDAVAVIHAGKRVTYDELNRRANRIAHALRKHDTQQGDVIGLCVERSVDMIAGILGILKAGAAYLPLDPSYPAQRLAFMLNDAGAAITLAQQRWAHLVAGEKTRVVVIDADDAFAGMPTDDLSCAEEQTQRAYVIYTSGSTGQPKGVPVTHRNLVHSTFARLDVYEQPVGCFLLLSSFAFDSSVAGIFWALCSGGALCLPMQREEQDANAISRLIHEHGVTHTLCLPSLYQVLLEHAPAGALRSLQVVIVAGESCPSSLLQWHVQVAPNAALYNEYGPTEGAVWCSVHHVQPAQSGPVPIGRPIPNMQLYIVDARNRPLPVGATGELLIGGDGLVDGYLSRPELTAARFIHAPGLSAQRLYRSGDLARYRADGEIEFLGRIDHQIKIRGHRIELEEIESALAAHPAVMLAAVVAMADAPALGEDVDALAEALNGMEMVDALRLLDDVKAMTGEDALAPAVADTQHASTQ